ncbi:hypothetical protein QUA08_23630, partial [Microcoleus sp. T3B2]|uniref:hypothetical protein n=1 Tax=Microcoleus sp. T3B2 TaxID=3055426 RepID=UPI002FD15EA0
GGTPIPQTCGSYLILIPYFTRQQFDSASALLVRLLTNDWNPMNYPSSVTLGKLALLNTGMNSRFRHCYKPA